MINQRCGGILKITSEGTEPISAPNLQLIPVYLPVQLSAFSRSERETYLEGTYISIARIPTFSGRDDCISEAVLGSTDASTGCNTK